MNTGKIKVDWNEIERNAAQAYIYEKYSDEKRDEILTEGILERSLRMFPRDRRPKTTFCTSKNASIAIPVRDHDFICAASPVREGPFGLFRGQRTRQVSLGEYMWLAPVDGRLRHDLRSSTSALFKILKGITEQDFSIDSSAILIQKGSPRARHLPPYFRWQSGKKGTVQVSVYLAIVRDAEAIG